MLFSRFSAIRYTLFLGITSGILLSFPLFLGERGYPLTPILQGLSVSEPGTVFLLLVFFALLCISLIARKEHLAAGAVGILIILVFLDQSRLQPWLYLYGWMLIVFASVSKDSETKEKHALMLFRFMIAATYIWSGLQKLNLGFIETGFPWLVSPIVEHLPDALRMPVYSLGVLAPLVEVAIGAGLLFRKTRTISVIGAVLMHLFILYLIGPFGHNTNSVVWPWNIVMVLFSIILFWRMQGSAKEIVWIKTSILQKIIFLFFGILPALSFIGLWDSYLSMALYSSNVQRAALSVPTTHLNQTAYNLAPYANPEGVERAVISFDDWSLGEMNVPAYPQTRIYTAILKKLCAETTYKIPFELTIFRPNGGSASFTAIHYSCSDFRSTS